MRSLLSLQQNKIHYKNYLFLLIICLLAYWPITFNVFSAKGDSIHYFLPYRYNVSLAIQNGEFPFWSPYIYLGHPLYGDMQSGAWNPFVWFFSLFGKYNINTFHAEWLLYLFIAGIGMYKLVSFLYKNSSVALLLASAYMLSGFLLGGQLINWAASAAFFPFIIYYYLVLVRQGKWAAAWKTGLFLYLLLVCGYPSFFIIISYILLFLFLVALIDRFVKKKYTLTISWSRFSLQQLLILATFIGLSLPAIISYADLLPYYSRGAGVSYAESNANTFEWQHFITILFPPTGGAPDTYSETDMTCRNIYFGIFSLIIFAAYPPRMNRRNILLIILVVLSAAFSLGDATPLRKLCYDLVPLMDTFRHPAQTRLFLIFGLLLLMAPGLRSFLEKTYEHDPVKNKIIKLASFSLVAILVVALIIALQRSVLLKTGISLSGGFNEFIKTILDSFRLYDAVLISAILQLFFLLLFLFWFLRKKLTRKKFSWLWVINLFVMAQLVIPITFVSQAGPKLINKFIHDNETSYPADRLNKPLVENSRDVYDISDRVQLDIGLSNFYKKTISITGVTYTPSFLSELDPIFTNKVLYDFIASKPAAYTADSVIKTPDTSFLRNNIPGNIVISDELPSIVTPGENENTAVIKKLDLNRVEISVNNKNDTWLVLTQSYHHDWKARVDNNKATIYKANIGFMAVRVPAGSQTVVFKFTPTRTIAALWIMLATMIGLLLAILLSLRRKKDLQRS